MLRLILDVFLGMLIGGFLLVFFTTLTFSLPIPQIPKLDNTWEWTPAEGPVAHYVVEKFVIGADKDTTQVLGQWNVYGTVQEPRVIILSTGIEIYKLRVIAVDAAGNTGPYSPESDWLMIFPEQIGQPGVPIVK